MIGNVSVLSEMTQTWHTSSHWAYLAGWQDLVDLLGLKFLQDLPRLIEWGGFKSCLRQQASHCVAAALKRLYSVCCMPPFTAAMIIFTFDESRAELEGLILGRSRPHPLKSVLPNPPNPPSRRIWWNRIRIWILPKSSQILINWVRTVGFNSAKSGKSRSITVEYAHYTYVFGNMDDPYIHIPVAWVTVCTIQLLIVFISIFRFHYLV